MCRIRLFCLFSFFASFKVFTLTSRSLGVRVTQLKLKLKLKLKLTISCAQSRLLRSAPAYSCYVLSHDVAGTAEALAMGRQTAEDGVDGSFELVYEINDVVTSGRWIGDCFLYTNNKGKLNYSVAGQIQTLAHLDTTSNGSTMHSILGYLAKEDRVFLIDKSMSIITYKVMLSMLQYQTAVVRGDFDTANELLPNIPESEYLAVARFLENQGFKEEVSTTSPIYIHYLHPIFTST